MSFVLRTGARSPCACAVTKTLSESRRTSWTSRPQDVHCRRTHHARRKHARHQCTAIATSCAPRRTTLALCEVRDPGLWWRSSTALELHCPPQSGTAASTTAALLRCASRLQRCVCSCVTLSCSELFLLARYALCHVRRELEVPTLRFVVVEASDVCNRLLWTCWGWHR